MTATEPLKLDLTVNIPSLLSVASAMVICLWWLFGLQAQTNANSTAIAGILLENAKWQQTWSQFTQARELTVRNYEQRMTTQENLAREIMRRLDEIRNEQIRLQQMRENRMENPR